VRMPHISACHVIGCHISQEKRVQSALNDEASSVCEGLTDIARHVIGCHSSQEKRVQNALAFELRGTIPSTLRNWGVDHTDLQLGG